MKDPIGILATRRILLLLGTAAWLFLVTFVLPSTPIYMGDSSPIFLHEAVRMLHGDVIYKDFFELTLPGTQFFYLGLCKLLGVRAWIGNVMLIVLGTSLAWTGVAMAERVLDGKRVWLPSLLFLGFAFTTEPDATHHWYSSLAVMVALAAILPERSTTRLAWAGALCGLATLFTQTRGPAAVLGIGLFLLWERRRKNQSWRQLAGSQASLWLPILLIVGVATAYLIAKAGFQQVFYCTVTFPLKYYPLWYWNTPGVYLTEVPGLSWPLQLPAVAIWLSVHALLPLVYLLFLGRWWRVAEAQPDAPWDRLMLLTTVGLCLFLSVASSPSWLRLCSVSLPALILLVWLVRSSALPARIFTGILWAAGAGLVIAQPLISQTDLCGRLNLPTGRVAFRDADLYEKFRWVQEHTRPGDYFYQASDCNLYYLLEVRNPTPVPFLTASGYTRPDQVQEVEQGLERTRARYVLWSVWLDVPHRGRFERFDGERLAPLRVYLRTHYHLVRNFADPDYDQVWERNP